MVNVIACEGYITAVLMTCRIVTSAFVLGSLVLNVHNKTKQETAQNFTVPPHD